MKIVIKNRIGGVEYIKIAVRMVWVGGLDIVSAMYWFLLVMTRKRISVRYAKRPHDWSFRIVIEVKGAKAPNSMGIGSCVFLAHVGRGNGSINRLVMMRHGLGHTVQSTYLGVLFVLFYVVGTARRMIARVRYAREAPTRKDGAYRPDSWWFERWASRLGGVRRNNKRS